MFTKIKRQSNFSFMINLVLCLGMFLSLNCSKDSPIIPGPEEKPLLTLTAYYSLDIPEPSGLAFTIDGKNLWTVSDKTNKVYKISLTGKILKTLSYHGNDLEGVTQNPLDSTIWIAEESKAEIVQLDSNGVELRREHPPVDGGNSSLEGITINTQNNHLFLVKEKNPLVLIELDNSLEIIKYKRVNFAEDLSGIFYDGQNQNLWITSDQSKKVFKTDLEGKVLQEFSVEVDKVEGIVVDVGNNLIYLVSDETERLYIFSINNF